ncbi:MAG TPA: energy transducer TonB, partial [Rhodothermales bacterium]|nr:energy transducer TonB [Rhodothermales bacterium]
DAELWQNRSGRVELRARVDTSGRVTQVRIVRSGGPAFDSSAVEAARLWRFRPALQAGQRVAVWVRMPFEFAPEYVVSDLAVRVASDIERMRFPAEVERGELTDGTVSLGKGSLFTSGFGLRPETCSASSRYVPPSPVLAPITGSGLTQYLTGGMSSALPSARTFVLQYLVRVDSDGYIESVALARASGVMIDDLMRNVLERWTFYPARCGDTNTPSSAIVTFNIRNRTSSGLYQGPDSFGQ